MIGVRVWQQNYRTDGWRNNRSPVVNESGQGFPYIQLMTRQQSAEPQKLSDAERVGPWARVVQCKGTVPGGGRLWSWERDPNPRSGTVAGSAQPSKGT
jgi:hypothetical protein